MNKFNEIFLRSKTVSERSNRGYKIYTDKEKFQLVDAATVAEAFEKSGIRDAIKIEIAGVITKSIFSQTELAEKQASQPMPKTPIEANAPPSETPPEASPAAPSGPA